MLQILIVLGLMVSLTLPNKASATGTNEKKCECSKGSVTEKPAGITPLESGKGKKTYGELHKYNEFKEALKWFKDHNLKLDTQNVGALEMETLKLRESGQEFHNVEHYVWIANSQKDIGLLVAVVDKTTKELLHLKANIFYNVSKDRYDYVQSFTKNGGYTEKLSYEEVQEQLNATPEEINTLNAVFNPCVHVSVWLCIYHCGIWAAATGAVGGLACSALCSYAFAYACS